MTTLQIIHEYHKWIKSKKVTDDPTEISNFADQTFDIYGIHEKGQFPQKIFAYDAGLHFIKRQDGKYYCIAGNEDILSDNFQEVEDFLFCKYHLPEVVMLRYKLEEIEQETKKAASKKFFEVDLYCTSVQTKLVYAENENEVLTLVEDSDWHEKEEVMDTEKKVKEISASEVKGRYALTAEGYKQF